MAAKTIDEAIEKALYIGPLSGVRDRLKSEIRDYMAHQFMIYQGQITANMTASDSSLAESIVLGLFDRIFKEIPAFKTNTDSIGANSEHKKGN